MLHHIIPSYIVTIPNVCSCIIQGVEKVEEEEDGEKKLCKLPRSYPSTREICGMMVVLFGTSSGTKRERRILRKRKMFTHLPSVGVAIKRWLLCEPEEI